jgi:hypothetical protein
VANASRCRCCNGAFEMHNYTSGLRSWHICSVVVCDPCNAEEMIQQGLGGETVQGRLLICPRNLRSCKQSPSLEPARRPAAANNGWPHEA